MYVSGSPFASDALPVRANGVRSGMVIVAGTVTVGALLPVAVTLPRRFVGPPCATSPTKPVHPLQFTRDNGLASTPARVPPKVIVNAVSVSEVTETVPPAGQPLIPWIAVWIPPAVKFVPRVIAAEVLPLY